MLGTACDSPFFNHKRRAVSEERRANLNLKLQQAHRSTLSPQRGPFGAHRL